VARKLGSNVKTVAKYWEMEPEEYEGCILAGTRISKLDPYHPALQLWAYSGQRADPVWGTVAGIYPANSITMGTAAPKPPRVYPLWALSVNVKTASNFCLPPFTA